MTGERPRLFVFTGGADASTPAVLTDRLGDRFEIRRIDNLSGLRTTGPRDLVVVDPDAVVRLAADATRGDLATDRAITLLNAISEGVCLATAEGDVLWSNDYFRSLDEATADRVASACRESAEWFERLCTLRRGMRKPAPPGGCEVSPDGPSSTVRYNLATDDGQRFYEVVVSQVAPGEIRTVAGGDADATSAAQVAAVVRDITAQRRMRQKMAAIDGAGYDLVGIGPDEINKLNAMERVSFLETKISKHVEELLNFDHFAIFMLDHRAKKLQLVMSQGLPEEIAELDLYSEDDGSGICGYVAETGRSYICNDVESDRRYLPGLAGAVSSLTVPLTLNDRVIGVMAVESKQAGAFTEEDRQFAEMFARHIAVSFHMLDLLVAERSTVNRSVSGRFEGELEEPLDDIVHEAEDLLAELRTDDPATAAHVAKIMRDVESIRRRVRDVAEGPQTLLGVEQALQRRAKDPLLLGRRVLVADDALKIRRVIGDVLRNRGCSVEVCEDGVRAIEHLDAIAGGEAEPFDLIISDIQMPDKNGYEVFAAARRATPDVPVILMTGFGYDPHHSIVRASQEGLRSVLFKPFQIEQLIELVRKVFEPEHASS
ncbi:MAG: response regulator [Planctomycetota bacterium]